MEFTTTLSVNNTASNVNFQTDLRLLTNRKIIELNAISTTNEYERRGAILKIEQKYTVIIEALVGLYDLGIEHSCSLASIISTFHSI
jgi:hypothetical protein